jgi:hypothetical protein
MTSEEFHDLDLLDTYFPVAFSGGQQGHFLGIKCGKCLKPLTDQNLRGTVVEGLANSFSVSSTGWCQDCHVFTCMEYRVHPDGIYSGLVDGEWRRWSEGPPPTDALHQGAVILFITLTSYLLWWFSSGSP